MRLGVDVGGTKIEVVALGAAGAELLRRRVPSPQGDYRATVEAVVGLVRQAERDIAQTGSVGVGIPGTISTATGLVKNANSTWLIGKPLGHDLSVALAREVRLANDANCFALSEAADGAAAGAQTVFGAILGTGVGGGVVVQGQILGGAHGIGGEWGHNPLPAMTAEESVDARPCYCGKTNCIESWCSGPAMAKEFFQRTGRQILPAEIAASTGTEERAMIARLTDRLARSLATVMNLIDPDAIVLGGGLSNIESLYRDLPPLVERHAFTPEGPPRIVKNRHGDSSGVRGAAWLWREEET
jgi:fructokinase